tara:strand:- start:109 stop:612 length:504 start_codon:yes stop_codon:yes gene_type:complete
VKRKVNRNYLEINSIKDLNESNNSFDEYSLEFLNKPDFQLNKFFYRNIGKKHHWIDRLDWSEKQWTQYTSDEKVKTYILKKSNDFVGYFELIFHHNLNEVEIAYLGLLEEYHNQKLGSYLLTWAIKKSFLYNPKRVWVHTCSLDHKNALNNYIARGMRVFKKESITI